MRSASSSQPNLNNEGSLLVVVVVVKGNNHSRISVMTTATRGQQIDKNCTQISKGAEMLVPEIQNRIIFLLSGA